MTPAEKVIAKARWIIACTNIISLQMAEDVWNTDLITRDTSNGSHITYRFF